MSIQLRRPIFLLTLLLIGGFGIAQNKKKEKKMVKKNMELAATQYKFLASITPKDSMPRSYDARTKKLIASDTEWWTSGFFPGTLWYIYEYTGDTAIRAEAERRLVIEEKEKYNTGHHDLGFMIFCSFGNAYRITGNPDYRDVVAIAAETLIKRYRPNIRSLQSWGSMKSAKSPVIIDNMMNLELLNWVSDGWREPKYKAIAIDHANTTIRNHFRPDNSSYHVIEYDVETGKILEKKTAQGYSNESAWARGQSWGLYGFTMMFRFTQDSTYLDQARKIATFLLNHPQMPADGIPYWDFDAPKDASTLRDASAASIMASALLELARYTGGDEQLRYLKMARKQLHTLSNSTYRAKPGENGGFILKHGVGHLPAKSEVDVPLTYADYYFIEALMRYEQWWLN